MPLYLAPHPSVPLQQAALRSGVRVLSAGTLNSFFTSSASEHRQDAMGYQDRWRARSPGAGGWSRRWHTGTTREVPIAVKGPIGIAGETATATASALAASFVGTATLAAGVATATAAAQVAALVFANRLVAATALATARAWPAAFPQQNAAFVSAMYSNPMRIS